MYRFFKNATLMEIDMLVCSLCWQKEVAESILVVASQTLRRLSPLKGLKWTGVGAGNESETSTLLEFR